MGVPRPESIESNTARADGSYFKIAQSYVEAGVCVFCELDATGQFPIASSKDGRAKLLLNKFPRSKFDMLAITTRHVETLDELTQKEVWALHEMKLLGRRLMRDVVGRTALIFLNREEGDKTVPHYHDQIQSSRPDLITWTLEDGRGDNLEQRAQCLKDAIERLKHG